MSVRQPIQPGQPGQPGPDAGSGGPARVPDEAAGYVVRLRTLFKTAAQIQLAADEDGVLAAAAAGLAQVGFSAHLELTDPHSGDLVLRCATLDPPALQPAVERRLGRPLAGIELDAAEEPYRTAIGHCQVVWVPDAAAWLARALPWLDQRALRVFSRLPGVSQGVCAPIRGSTEVYGAISVWGPVVSEADVPAVGLLGRHAGAALDGLRLRRREVERARLDGALLVARTTAHAINNALSPIRGFSELLAGHPTVRADVSLSAYARLIVDGAAQVATHVRRLQRIVRLEEEPSPLGPNAPVLNLERSTDPEAGTE